MREKNLFLKTLKAPSEFLIIFFSFFVARKIRFFGDLIPNLDLPIQTIDTNLLINFALFGAGIYVLILAIHGLYFIKNTYSRITEFFQIILYGIYSMIFFSFFLYLGQDFFFITPIPRLIVIFAFLLSIIFIIIFRIILENIYYFLIKKQKIKKNNLILITNSRDISSVVEDIKNSKIYKIIGYINDKKIDIENLKFLGSIKNLEKKIKSGNCDEILYIASDFGKKDLYNIWELARVFSIRYRYLPNYFDITKTNTMLSLMGNTPLIEVKNTPLENWGKVFKRFFDIFFAIIFFILSLPVVFFLGIIIKIEDPSGPIFYKNKRVGRYGRVFNLYKLRYMKWEFCTKDAYSIKNDKALILEKDLIKKKSTRNGPLYKIENDPRKTKVGNFIEKYSLDELPQFFNVIIGNMSLVGPRPHQPREVKKYSRREKFLLTIKPGITGMAQVNGREKNDFKKESNLDIFYIENWSILLDIKIIFRTFNVIFRKK